MGLGAALIAASVGTLAAYALITGPMQAEFIFLPMTLALTVIGGQLDGGFGAIGHICRFNAPAAPVLRSQ